MEYFLTFASLLAILGILEKRNLLAFFIYFICNDTRNFYLLGIILTYFEWKFLFMFI